MTTWLRALGDRWGRWHRRWFGRGVVAVSVANFLIAAAAAAVTAALGLVLGDWLPTSGASHIPDRHWVLLLVTAVVLLAVLIFRGTIVRRIGTLFYVRLIDDAFTDLHSEALQAAVNRRLALRSVTRWADIGDLANPTGVADLVVMCRQVAAALEMCVNTDRNDTAYTLAANLAWPAALAIGAELPIVARLQLLELERHRPNDPRRRVETTFDLPTTVATAQTRLIVESLNLVPAGHGDRVGVLLTFTVAALGMVPATVFAGMGVSECIRIRPHGISPDLAELQDATFDGETLHSFAQALPPALVDLKKRFEGRELVIAAAITKSMAVALGWGLGLSDCAFFRGTHLLHWDHASSAYVPLRVHPSQPTSPPTDRPS